MKKLIIILCVGLFGCSKENICIECQKQGEQAITVCNDETNNISVIAYGLTNEGYNCVRVED